MKKLVYLLPTVAALALAGCGDDTAADTDAGGSTGEDTTGSPTTNDPTVDPGTTTDETTGDPTVDPDTGGSDSSSGDPPPLCDETDECTPDTVVEDCGEFFSCVGCFCVEDGDPPLCPDGWGDGEYLDCGADGIGVCTSKTGLTPGCGVDDIDQGACYFSGCEDACDCPAAPDPAFDELVTCDDIIGDTQNDCYLDCSGGAECPDGMYCFLDFICVNGEAAPPDPGYGDCVNMEGCANANEECIVDVPAEPSLGFCTSACADAGDCNPAPATGDAPVTCEDLTGDMMGNCFLDCSSGETCPDGMSCAFGAFCAWDLVPPTGYGDCATQPDTICLEGEVCVASNDKTNGDTEVCAASGCVDPMADCPDLPPTGDAPVVCLDIDGMKGDECVLDCSGGQTCPDGAVCTDGGFCSYALPTFTFQEDFQGGAIPKGWTVHDVDGQPVAGDMSVSWIDDGWVVADSIPGAPVLPEGEFWAISTSWYDPAGAADDWIITPVITLGATATLQWSAFTLTGDFPDGYEVYVVPTNVAEFVSFVGDGDPTDFLALDSMVEPSAAPVLTIAAEEDTVQNRSVNIDALAGQDVYVAFRNNSDDEWLLFIDDIAIVE